MRFDGNVAGGLPWRFVPETTSLTVRIGEPVTVNYKVVNESARETAGSASYNVTPPTTGASGSREAITAPSRGAPQANAQTRLKPPAS